MILRMVEVGAAAVPELTAECEKQVKALLDEGLIVPSKSAWASSPVFVPSAPYVGHRCTCFNKRVQGTNGVSDASGPFRMEGDALRPQKRSQRVPEDDGLCFV
eukprot:GHVS01051499.1.p1 GENE.GHVS01051499.1~~GHVS01051499.1.p1  ORF type:complete len:103 (+),score=4.34 GHVS01051499.1:104-412(+)